MGYLYNAGDPCTSESGGWLTHSALMTNSEMLTDWPHGPKGTIAYNSSNMVLTYNDDYGGIMTHSQRAINFREKGIDSITINCSTTVKGWGYDNYRFDNALTYANWIIALIPINQIVDEKNYIKSYVHDYGRGYINGASSTASKTESFTKTITGLSQLPGAYHVVIGIYRSTPGLFTLTINSITTAGSSTPSKTIWDHNGTNYSRIKTIFDDNGTNKSRIKWIYDCNASNVKTIVYSGDVDAVVNSTLQSGFTLTNVAKGSGSASTSGTTLTTKATAGAYFGCNVSRFNTDIRNYDSVTVAFTAPLDVGQQGYYPSIFVVGTESQIAGIKFTAYGSMNFNGCTQIGGGYGLTNFHIFTADLTSYKNNSSALYLGCIIGSYNSGTNTMVINEVVYT